MAESQVVDDTMQCIKDDLGPFPSKKIFLGKMFMVIKLPKSNQESSQSLQTPPFCKDHLTKQIQAGGGTIIPNFNDVKWNDIALQKISNVYLIINIHSPINKVFLKSVVVGLPCVSHRWIIACCKESTFFHHGKFMHPVGRSVTTGSLVDWHSCGQIFNEFSFALMSHNEQSKEFKFWRNILIYAGGYIIPIEEVLSFKPLSAVLMIDKSYPTPQIKNLIRAGFVLLTRDWVIECIIVGNRVNWHKKRSFTWHCRM